MLRTQELKILKESRINKAINSGMIIPYIVNIIPMSNGVYWDSEMVRNIPKYLSIMCIERVSIIINDEKHHNLDIIINNFKIRGIKVEFNCQNFKYFNDKHDKNDSKPTENDNNNNICYSGLLTPIISETGDVFLCDNMYKHYNNNKNTTLSICKYNYLHKMINNQEYYKNNFVFCNRCNNDNINKIIKGMINVE